MRKVIVSEMISIDGLIEAEHGGMNWFVQDAELNAYAMELLESVDTIIYGRTTYEIMASFWPFAPGDFAARTNQLKKIVFTTTLRETPWGEWEHARPIHGGIAEEITNLKRQPGKDMVVYGSGSVVRQLTNLGLVDEYRLIVNPVILGKGKMLFENLHDRMPLKLVDAKVFACGGVALTYIPA
ncbi:dihydrofolate reductase family protein [Paenibacillus sp. GYB003]|uniref:dihydrofolate reductase family protein n=1 Tax=Paenibacillus sp. GYB003 TaxID=2994392 RepID=UPI002F965E8D